MARRVVTVVTLTIQEVNGFKEYLDFIEGGTISQEGSKNMMEGIKRIVEQADSSPYTIYDTGD